MNHPVEGFLTDTRIGAAPTNDVDTSRARPVYQFLSGSALGIHPGEGRLAWLFFVYFLLLATCHYVGKSVRFSTFVDTFGATRLPYAYLLVAVAAVPVLILYSRLARRFSQHTLIVAFCVLQTSGLVFFYWLYSFESSWVAMAFYVWTNVAFGVGVTQFWSYANQVFDARQARRLFALIGAGGLLGAIPGGQIASLAGRFGGTRWALIAAAFLTLVIIGVIHWIEKRRPTLDHRSSQQISLARIEAARGGFQILRGSKLLVLIAVLVFFSVLVNQMVDIQFGWVVERETTGLDERTRVFGNFFTLVGVFGFLFQILFTQRIHRALGVAVGMRILPFSVAIASLPLILSFGADLIAPIWVAWVLKLAENSFRHSVEQSTRELLFMPVAAAIRLQAKTFIDIFVQRCAKGFAAVMLLPISVGLVSPRHLSWSILAVAIIWLWTTTLVRREYVGAFRSGLKTGGSQPSSSIDTHDATTLTMLVESLGSSDPRQVRHALELLEVDGRGRLVPPIMLHHEDPEIRRTTLRILASAGRTDAVDRIERAIGDDDPQVRTSAIQALAVLRREDAADIMADRLRDADPRIRSAAIASLSRGPDDSLRERASVAMQEMLADSAPETRIEAAKALAEIPEPEGSGSLVQLLYDRKLEVVGQTITSIRTRMERDGPNPMYIPILISLMGNRRLKLRSREALVAYGETAVQALVLFMTAEDEQIWVRRAMPKTLARLACPAAAAGLIGSLDVKDAHLRRRIIESLASLRVRNAEFRFDTSTVARQIRTEAQWYLRSFADLWTISQQRETRLVGPYARWQAAGRVPSLLQQALAQRMVMAVSDIFGLLQLIHPPRDIEAAHRSLVSGHISLRANALEYLDNSLSGSVRRDVFAVIDDVPPEEKLQRASQSFGIVAESPETTVGRLLNSDFGADPAGELLAFAAIYSVYADKLERYYPDVHSIATRSPEGILRETAEWVCARVDRHAASAATEDSRKGRSVTRGGPDMALMAQIEKVVFLQGVDLFGSCNAEQLVQLAAIAKDRRIEGGEAIYRRNEPAAALYCLVDGVVAVTDEQQGTVAAAQGDTLGVRDILSGQLRSGDATADGECLMLEIEAEDLFDLMSDNIEIVRALFRQLTGSTSEGML